MEVLDNTVITFYIIFIFYKGIVFKSLINQELCFDNFLQGYEIQAFTCHSKSLCDHTHSIAASIPVSFYVTFFLFYGEYGKKNLNLSSQPSHVHLSLLTKIKPK